MLKAVVLIINLGFWGNSLGQNLVKNPSFELGQECPPAHEGTMQLEAVADWSAVAGSPTFWSYDCPMSVEEKAYIQKIDLPPASEGHVFAGIGLDVEGDYLQGHLTKTLEEGKQYLVKLRVRFSGAMCNAAIRDLGVLLTAEELKKTKQHRAIKENALVLQNNTQTEISSRYEWETIHAVYLAEGEEKYLTIGNFQNNNRNVFENRKKEACSYLFVDAVSVAEFKTVQLPVFKGTADLKPLQRYLISNLRFALGTPELKKTKHRNLDSLVFFLQKNPSVKLEISAHTDDSRDEAMNYAFTKAQAQSIKNYLVKKGAKSEQILARGYGSTINVALNTTDQGRAKNNRIEIRWLKEDEERQ